VIGYLKGIIKSTDEDSVLLLVAGVGYEISCSQQTLVQLTAEIDAELWIYTHVREDQLNLYGFLNTTEKQLFMSLLKVNGIGPKVAIKVLSAAPMNSIIRMIDAGDVKGLSGLPKIGKKTAEQIILELKGKLVSLDDVAVSGANSARSDIVSALVNLGFKLSEVEQVVAGMQADIDLQTGVRKGLQVLTHQV
jgi:Holliday junction DNA helicase RuvA